ncbi:MAG: SUF system NifU family Fe-S cluster assembly protein [Thermoplasmata archaeon]|uniref:SUF system NifU family Fe-S cluster assembly protein n=1 Tax=Candidatus Sysuiplasma superficiale TaxID=2823368 RepID=A0A8J7YSA3_9ARCH|nr:SUF system NifU family Fe-S cluster assembly protein [Candidatus Sysuiplasma superficiale]MBX8643353.1 SUF system NifU family Fe-S cluster assembly protein [Candidatus Sysuiplasma superficiale]MCL4347218.1 SUF system NifU family Fe-S cluster assembly protein [Candidatus Thermoplasmatota archaeon]
MGFDIYQEEIIEHYKSPHNKGAMDHPDLFGHGNNPVCGDDITIYLKIKNDIIEDVSFDGRGCAISQASASMLTDRIKGMKLEEIERLSPDYVKEMLHIPLSAVRMKCATLSLKTLQETVSAGGVKNDMH